VACWRRLQPPDAVGDPQVASMNGTLPRRETVSSASSRATAEANAAPDRLPQAPRRVEHARHHQVLTELGLEPLLDPRLRLGEASGAALALPLITLVSKLHHGMRRFDEAGVDRADPAP